MITSAFIALAALVITLLLLPLSLFGTNHGFPDSVDVAVSFISDYVSKYANTFFPLDDLQVAISFIIVFELSIILFKVLRWVWGYMPFIGR